MIVPKTTKEELQLWRTGQKRMESEVTEIDGIKYEKITVDPNNVIYKAIPAEAIVRKGKREPKPSAEPESGTA